MTSDTNFLPHFMLKHYIVKFQTSPIIMITFQIRFIETTAVATGSSKRRIYFLYNKSNKYSTGKKKAANYWVASSEVKSWLCRKKIPVVIMING